MTLLIKYCQKFFVLGRANRNICPVIESRQSWWLRLMISAEADWADDDDGDDDGDEVQ